ncbi:MAG: dTDP-4-dehydrorhamnose reductase [bacterium]
MRILVTGHRGQLGSELMASLGREHEVTGFDLEDVNITQKEAVIAYIAAASPEVVLHTAAYTDVDACQRNVGTAMAINAEGAGHVAEACRQVGARMVYFSTDYVFDGNKQGDYVEEDIPNPPSVYGRSKLAGEAAVAAVLDNHAIVRIAWLYSQHGQNFVKLMIREGSRQLRGDRGCIRVVDDQYGNPTWTADVAAQVRPLLDARHRGIFHATAIGSTSWYGLARKVLETLDMNVSLARCRTSEYPRPALRPANSCLANSRLAQAGINLMRDWDATLTEFLTLNAKRLLDEN